MSYEDLIKALVGFVLGLIAKLIYDFWTERRKRKSLAFTKTILASFTKNTLEKQLQDETRVLYSNIDVKSIHLVRVKLKNVGYAAVKHQTFSVKFKDDAQVLGIPKLIGSDEDLILVRPMPYKETHVRRFIVDVIQKGREIAIDFVVINNESEDFDILPGIDTDTATSMDPSDLDVDVSLAGERLSVNLIYLAKQWVVVSLLLPIMYLVKDVLADTSAEIGSIGIASLFNFAIAGLWFAVMQTSYRLLPLLLEWIEAIGAATRVGGDYIYGDKISIGDILRSMGIAVGRTSSAFVKQLTGEYESIDKAFAFLHSQLDEIELSISDKSTATRILVDLEREAYKGDLAQVQRILSYLTSLTEIESTIQASAINIFLTPIKGLNKAFRDAALEFEASE